MSTYGVSELDHEYAWLFMHECMQVSRHARDTLSGERVYTDCNLGISVTSGDPMPPLQVPPVKNSSCFLFFLLFTICRSHSGNIRNNNTREVEKKISAAVLHMKTAVRIAKNGLWWHRQCKEVPWTRVSSKLPTHEAQYSIASASKERVHQGRQHMLENLFLLNPTL